YRRGHRRAWMMIFAIGTVVYLYWKFGTGMVTGPISLALVSLAAVVLFLVGLFNLPQGVICPACGNSVANGLPVFPPAKCQSCGIRLK
ncbi:MAG: hypothetical protein AAFQ82_09650, partial [Myxococcota bacterium]